MKSLKSLATKLKVNLVFPITRSFISFSTVLILDRSSKVSLGKGSRIRGFCEIYMEKNSELFFGNSAVLMRLGEIVVTEGASLVVGENCYIGSNANIRCHKEITIGKGTKIAQFVSIIGGQYEHSDAEKVIEYKRFQSKSVSIGENVWIGVGVVILPGVKIGNGAVIGAGSIVTKDVESNSVVAGNPAKQIGLRR